MASVRESISCLVLILPPVVKSWDDFIYYVAINCFPGYMLPVNRDESGKIIYDDDFIRETEDTLQLIEFKSYKGKYSVSFKIPYPRDTDDYYKYMMEEVVEPLMVKKDKVAKLFWTHNKHEYFIQLSLVEKPKKTLMIPNQDKFVR